MQSDEDVNMKKEALRTLLDYSSPESSYDPDSTRANEEISLIFGNNSFVSFSQRMENCNQSTPVSSQKRGGVGNRVSDSEFLDSEAGKQLLLNDQVSHERFLIQRTDCTECSSWTFCSREDTSSAAADFSKLKQKTISVGQFIGMYSETLTFSENQENKKPFLNYFTSTPKEKRRKSRSMSSLLDMESKESSYTSFTRSGLKTNDTLCMGTPASVKPLKFSTPKWAEKNSHSGSVAHKNILRLKREEKQLRCTDETLSSNSKDWDKTITNQLKDPCATGSETITRQLKISSSDITNGSMDRSYLQWFIEPQLVILNPSKGNRVTLVNKSNKNLKFKTTFDSRKMNVCPLSGTVLAMDKIGIRICISQYAKKQNASFEDDVKIMIGKNEKSIQVQYFKEEKSKYLKERSYILF